MNEPAIPPAIPPLRELRVDADRPVETSETHPFQLTEIPFDWPENMQAGKLWICPAPGRQETPFRKDLPQVRRDLSADMACIRQAEGPVLVISLLDENEMEELHIHDFADRAILSKLALLSCPVPEFGPPPSLAEITRLCSFLRTSLFAGMNIVLQGRNRGSRTLLVSACAMISVAGTSVQETLAFLSPLFPAGCTLTQPQDKFVHAFAGEDYPGPSDKAYPFAMDRADLDRRANKNQSTAPSVGFHNSRNKSDAADYAQWWRENTYPSAGQRKKKKKDKKDKKDASHLRLVESRERDLSRMSDQEFDSYMAEMFPGGERAARGG